MEGKGQREQHYQKTQEFVPGPLRGERTEAPEKLVGETRSGACVCPFIHSCPVLPAMHFEKDQLSEGGWPRT